LISIPFSIGEDILGISSSETHILLFGERTFPTNRRGENELDYLPSQYLCEFIKSIGFDGVEYRSSLYEGGFNIALFDDNKVNCIKVKTIQVKKRHRARRSKNNC
jgi:hypothetical protein